MPALKENWPMHPHEFRISEKRPRVPAGTMNEFGRTTTVHGVRHFTDKRKHICERIFWATLLVISSLVAYYLLHNVWSRWSEGPIFVGLADKTESIKNVPFPAITICPESKAKTQIFNYTDTYHLMRNLSTIPTDRNYFDVISQICDAHLAYGVVPEDEHTIDGQSLIDALKELAPTPEEVLFYCKWRNNPTGCLQFFAQVWTDEGSCFTFNLQEADEIYTPRMSLKPHLINNVTAHNYTKSSWSLENGYNFQTKNSSDLDATYPYYSYGAGQRGAFTTLLRLYEYDIDYICRGPVQGYKVALHLPNESPQISTHFFRVPLSADVIVTVIPRVTKTADSLLRHPPETRGCYYNFERSLNFFKEYTQRNCELECIANITARQCGCVKFSMPRDPSTPICGASKISCYNNAADELLKFNSFDDGDSPNASNDCKCLPACTSISYDYEISQADFDYKSLFLAFKNPLDEFPMMLSSRLTVSFKENHFVALKRHELYSHVDLLALCGGILALFFGASMFSIFEIVHFVSAKLFCRKQKRVNLDEDILGDQDN